MSLGCFSQRSGSCREAFCCLVPFLLSVSPDSIGLLPPGRRCWLDVIRPLPTPSASNPLSLFCVLKVYFALPQGKVKWLFLFKLFILKSFKCIFAFRLLFHSSMFFFRVFCRGLNNFTIRQKLRNCRIYKLVDFLGDFTWWTRTALCTEETIRPVPLHQRHILCNRACFGLSTTARFSHTLRLILSSVGLKRVRWPDRRLKLHYDALSWL